MDDYETDSHIYKLDYNDYRKAGILDAAKIKMSLEGLQWKYNYADNEKVTRSSAWYTKAGCNCEYFYGCRPWPANDFQPWMEEFCTNLKTLLNLDVVPNAMNFNKYESGDQSLGFHSDGEELFKDIHGKATIVSISFGASRLFEIKQMYSSKADWSVMLNEGDILIMFGKTQLYYQHGVPKHDFASVASSSAGHTRYNITCRFIHKHLKKCSAAVMS